MSQPIQAPRGTFDVLPEQAAARDGVERRTRATLEAAGYARIETPTFEATEVFARGVGEATDIVRKEMYSFQAGDRSYTLRPEGTAPVCRAYAQHGMHKLPQPVKLWYMSSFFRHERTQAGRQRQFWQIGAETLGSEDPAVDAEAIVLLANLLADLGVRELRLRLSSLGGPESRAAYRELLQEHLRARREMLSDDVRERIELNPLRAFDSDHPGTREALRDAPLLLDHITAGEAEHFAQVRALLDAADVGYDIDPTLVRGLDYYTRTLFEFESTALGAQSGVAGGGRYDGLVAQLGGPATPGFGWAAGVERILLAGSPPPAPAPVVDLFVALDAAPVEGEGPADGGPGDRYAQARRAAFQIAYEARLAGLGAQIELAGRSLKTQLRHADRIGARYVAIVSAEGAKLKDMQGSRQEDLAHGSVVHAVLRGRRDL